MTIDGPLAADSAFVPAMRDTTDAYLAMYHDQGLPVLKALGFRDAVNITLGLPILRTSVDHQAPRSTWRAPVKLMPGASMLAIKAPSNSPQLVWRRIITFMPKALGSQHYDKYVIWLRVPGLTLSVAVHNDE